MTEIKRKAMKNGMKITRWMKREGNEWEMKGMSEKWQGDE